MIAASLRDRVIVGTTRRPDRVPITSVGLFGPDAMRSNGQHRALPVRDVIEVLQPFEKGSARHRQEHFEEIKAGRFADQGRQLPDKPLKVRVALVALPLSFKCG